MNQFSTQTLSLAIFALAMDRCRLADEIAELPDGAEDEEVLYDQVVMVERALAELSGPYDEQVEIDRMFPDYETQVANAKIYYAEMQQKRA